MKTKHAKRVLISEAGIAGLALAYWLRRYGFTPNLIERAHTQGWLQGGHSRQNLRSESLRVKIYHFQARCLFDNLCTLNV